MAAYADFTYYATSYLGTAIAESDFPQLALRASAVIDQITFGRAATETVAATIVKIKNAMCAVAEEIQTAEADGNIDGIVAETVGSHSVTYAETATKQLTARDKYSYAAQLYLGDTGLMFRGFADDEYSTG